MLLHERLKDLRLNQFKVHKTQKEISGLFGIVPNLYSLMESGKRLPTYKQLETLIKYYDVEKNLELEMRKAWFLIRLPEDVYDCHQSINAIVQSEMSQIEIDDYVDSKRGGGKDKEIYQSSALNKIVGYLKNLDEDRREQDLDTFVKLLRLPMKESVLIKKICNLMIDSNEELLDKIYTVVNTLKN